MGLQFEDEKSEYGYSTDSSVVDLKDWDPENSKPKKEWIGNLQQAIAEAQLVGKENRRKARVFLWLQGSSLKNAVFNMLPTSWAKNSRSAV